jgi:2-keto-4-pentenoate hydratase/2-oxohepta-3-ene-1,7-dioic acid hydratase in catechol pathway
VACSEASAGAEAALKICRYRSVSGETGYGVLHDESVTPLGGLPWDGPAESGKELGRESIRLLAPVVPTKIIAVGRNYAAHARELGNEIGQVPLIFSKPPSSVIGPHDEILLPPESKRVDFEGELAIVMGRRCRRVPRDSWRDVVAGFTCANDVTARDLQKQDGQFTRGKGFDTFCPLGPWITTDLDPGDLGVRTRVNGALRQDGRTSEMAFPVPFLIEFVTSVMTLEPGDLILTGTPEGVGPLTPGDVVEVEVEGVGVLNNHVQRESEATH